MTGSDFAELRQLERRADHYGLYMHHSTDDTLKWLQVIRQAADLRTRINPEALQRHKDAIKAQGLTAKQADDMFYRLSANPYARAA